MIKFIEKYKLFILYLPLGLYWLLIFTLTSLPSNKLPSVHINDKIAHLLAYFGLSVLMGLSFYFQKKYSKVKNFYYLISIIIVAIYAALDEIHQMYIPGRYCDINDWLADMVGAIMGSICVFLFLFFTTKKVKNDKSFS